MGCKNTKTFSYLQKKHYLCTCIYKTLRFTRNTIHIYILIHMNSDKLCFVPFGGSANRMRAIASAVNLARQCAVQLDVVWFREWAMEARLSDLFQPFEAQGITMRDASWWEYYVFDRPRKKNLWLPMLPQRMMFKRSMSEQESTARALEGYDFNEWVLQGGASILPSCMKFGNFADYGSLLREIFHPVKAVTDEVGRFRENFSAHTIGAHIRRTDSVASIKHSPTEAFISTFDREIDMHNDTRIFIATDDEPTRTELQERYGSRIITSSRPATRKSAEGVRDGLVDMYTLAATQCIYGSVGSSFSVMAAEIGGVELIMCKSEANP